MFENPLLRLVDSNAEMAHPAFLVSPLMSHHEKNFL